MFELLPKSIQRKLNLIAYLLDHPTSPPSIHFLMDYLNITYPTLKHDISELNELFDQYFNITITKTQISLKAFVPLSMAFFTYMLKQDLTIMSLINECFLQHINTFKALAQKIYISRSVMYHDLTQLKDFITNHYSALSITTHPVQITGPERIVRQFFTDYYFLGYNLSNWPFDQVSQSAIEDLMLLIAEKIPLIAFFSDHPILPIILAINVIRYRQGHLVEDIRPAYDYDACRRYLSDPINHDHLHNLEDRLGITFSNEAVEQLLVNIISHQTSYDTHYMWQCAQTDPTLHQALITLKSDMLSLMQAFHIQSIDEEALDLFLLTAYNLCTFHSTDSNSFEEEIYQHEQDCLAVGTELERIDPHFLTQMQRILTAFQEQMHIPCNDTRTLQATWYYCHIFPQTLRQLKTPTQPIRLGLYTINQLQRKHWAYEINLLFDDKIQLVSIHSPNSLLHLEANQVDALLTALPIELKQIKTRYISGYPSGQDVEWIYQLLFPSSDS